MASGAPAPIRTTGTPSPVRTAILFRANPTYDVVIGNPSLCTLGRFVRVQTVNVLQGSTLNLGNNGYLWANTGFGNAGLITLNSTGKFSGLLRASGNSNVVAGGEIFMSDHAANSVTAGAGGKVLTIFTGGRIGGAGSINQYHGDDIRGSSRSSIMA